MSEKKIKIPELASLCEVSTTAITKKCKSDNGAEYYKGADGNYPVIQEFDEKNKRLVKKIVMTDEQIDAEIKKAKKNKNVYMGVGNPAETTVNNDYNANSSTNRQNQNTGDENVAEGFKFFADALQNLTLQYGDNQKQMMIEFNKVILEKERQILRLEDFENRSSEEQARLQNERKALELQNKMLLKQKKLFSLTSAVLGALVVLLLSVLIGLFTAFSMTKPDDSKVNHNAEPVIQTTNSAPIAAVPPQTVNTSVKPVTAANTPQKTQAKKSTKNTKTKRK